MNWKAAAKHFYRQFLLWVSAYNEMTLSSTDHTADRSVTYVFRRRG